MMMPTAVLRDAAQILPDYRSPTAPKETVDKAGCSEEHCISGMAGGGRGEDADAAPRRWRRHHPHALLAAVLYIAARRADLGVVIPEVATAAGVDARMVGMYYRQVPH